MFSSNISLALLNFLRRSRFLSYLSSHIYPGLNLSFIFFLIVYRNHGPPQERQLLPRRKEILKPPPTPSTPRSRRKRFVFETSIQSRLLGSRPLRSKEMLGEEADAIWLDARASDRTEVPGRGCIVCLHQKKRKEKKNNELPFTNLPKLKAQCEKSRFPRR